MENGDWNEAVFRHRPSSLDSMTRLLIQLVLFYRATLGRFMGGHCRFHPTCSQYAIDALQKYGTRKGGWRALKRIARCRPGGGSGYDPA